MEKQAEAPAHLSQRGEFHGREAKTALETSRMCVRGHYARFLHQVELLSSIQPREAPEPPSA